MNFQFAGWAVPTLLVLVTFFLQCLVLNNFLNLEESRQNL